MESFFWKNLALIMKNATKKQFGAVVLTSGNFLEIVDKQ